MFQRLPILKTCNTSENLLIEIMEIISSLYWANKLAKQVYDNWLNQVRYILENRYCIH